MTGKRDVCNPFLVVIVMRDVRNLFLVVTSMRDVCNTVLVVTGMRDIRNLVLVQTDYSRPPMCQESPKDSELRYHHDILAMILRSYIFEFF